MASQEVISELGAGRTAREYRAGGDTELLTINTAKLFVLCGERFEAARALRCGDFAVHMIRIRTSHHVSMVTCRVGDHQWMLSKDVAVLLFEAWTFVFALPGFLYGLELPRDTADHESKMLETIFSQFCAYRDISGKEDCESSSHPEADTWARAYRKMEKLPTEAAGEGAAAAAGAATTAADTEPAEGKKVQRAVRTSAIVKLLSRSLLTGAMDPVRHLHLATEGGEALPSMWVVGDLLHAIEPGQQRAAVPPPDRRAPHGHGGWWSLNAEGIRLLLELVWAASKRSAAAVKRPRTDALLEEEEEEEEEEKGSSSSAPVGREAVPRSGGRAKDQVKKTLLPRGRSL